MPNLIDVDVPEIYTGVLVPDTLRCDTNTFVNEDINTIISAQYPKIEIVYDPEPIIIWKF
jgi:hypothetical protein